MRYIRLCFECLILLIMMVLLFGAPAANATYVHATPTVVAKAPPAGGGGGGNWHLCPTPAGVFVVCPVVVGIVADEVKRTIEGPACATGKMTRRSYFGIVRDEPKLWRPLCNFKKAKGKKLWAKGK